MKTKFIKLALSLRREEGTFEKKWQLPDVEKAK